MNPVYCFFHNNAVPLKYQQCMWGGWIILRQGEGKFNSSFFLINDQIDPEKYQFIF